MIKTQKELMQAIAAKDDVTDAMFVDYQVSNTADAAFVSGIFQDLSDKALGNSGTMTAQKVKRKVQIVYSVDSAASMIAAATIKRMIEAIDPQSTAGEMYEFKISEVADLNRRNTNNTYIWLDVAQTLEDVDADHLVLLGSAVGHWSDSAFSDQLLEYVESGNFITRTMSDIDPPSNEDKEHSVLHYGILINALLALSCAAPEIEFPDSSKVISRLSGLQNDLSKFYSPNCKANDLLRIFGITCAAQGELGHVAPSNLSLVRSDEPLYKRIRNCETIALTYHQLYTQARIRIMSEADTQLVAVKSGTWLKPNQVFTVVAVRMPEYFWLARRIIQMNKKYYHNTRLVSYGLHMTTNLSAKAAQVQQRMEHTSTAF